MQQSKKGIKESVVVILEFVHCSIIWITGINYGTGLSYNQNKNLK
jgi:hypothetical protein